MVFIETPSWYAVELINCYNLKEVHYNSCEPPVSLYEDALGKVIVKIIHYSYLEGHPLYLGEKDKAYIPN